MAYAGSAPDPFLLYDTDIRFSNVTSSYRQTSGLTPSFFTINPALKTLVLFVTGQSIFSNVCPTLFTPVNASAVDQLNVYDGNLYNIGGPVLGATFNPALVPPLGPGNVSVRVADTLVTNGKFNRVIIVNLAVGSTSIAQWNAGIHGNRVAVAMKRLAARGVTPATPGATFACLMSIGHTDLGNGTTQSSYAADAAGFISKTYATGFSGRIFWTLESASGATSNAIRSAQAALPNGTTVWSGGDTDSSSIGTSDGTHPSDAGAATMSTAVVTAMAASGAPFS
jgi:hypothetical protein